ncbi:MAG: hypothetical protein MZU91_07355 [Desulfosudis oleivorans]|nr:hypothetical protein [Desulfosudis oleivorans]
MLDTARAETEGLCRHLSSTHRCGAALALAAAWLVIVNLFALMAFNRLNLAPDTAFEWMSAGTVTAGSAELGHRRAAQPLGRLLVPRHRQGRLLPARRGRTSRTSFFSRSTRCWCALLGALRRRQPGAGGLDRQQRFPDAGRLPC